MAIPSEVSELTPEWFSEIFHAEVSKVDLVDAHSGSTGRACVRLTGDSALPGTVFVKLQPFDPEQREYVRKVGMGISEARLYATVGDELPVRIPHVWHSSYDESDGSFVMVLEDLAASGCSFPEPTDDDIVDVARSLVDELGLLHSTYWGQELDWMRTRPRADATAAQGGERKKGTLAAESAQLVQSALDQYGSDMQAEFTGLGELYVARYLDIGAVTNEGERTLIHGDDHIGNLFVDGGRTGLLDWAISRRGMGMRDVAYFTCNSLRTEVRRAEEHDLVERYRVALGKGGVEIDESSAFEQYRLQSLQGWLAAVTTAAVGSRWQKFDEIAYPAMKRATEAIADLDLVGLLNERLGPG